VDAASVDVGSPASNDFVKSLALLDVGRFPNMSFAPTQVKKFELGPSEGLPR
jgi:polyisoprenoid-binding protein YceI